jgi:hypothetical protein
MLFATDKGAGSPSKVRYIVIILLLCEMYLIYYAVSRIGISYVLGD